MKHDATHHKEVHPPHYIWKYFFIVVNNFVNLVFILISYVILTMRIAENWQTSVIICKFIQKLPVDKA